MRDWWTHILRGPIPASLLVCAGFVALATWLAPASGTEPPAPRVYGSRGALDPEEGANVTTAVVGVHESASVHHLLVKEGVAAHYHRTHDETVTVLAGTGVLALGAEEHEVGPGTVVLVPRGTVHALRVTGAPVEAVSVFSPAFDGEDRIFVDE